MSEVEPNDAGERVPDVDLTAGRVPQRALSDLTETFDVVVRPSFEEFYRAERAPIARALAVTLHDTQLAGEAADEAMARAYQRWTHVQALDNPAAWVYRVGLNWSLSRLRRLTRPAPRWVSGSGVAPPTPIQDPAVDRALGELSVDQRAVVVCRLLLGYSEAQTADLLRIKPGTVKSRLHRALERLHPLLAPLHGSDEETSR
jgi:DNA-directed RNA polymerase specialized sigma24 family protein